MTIYICQLDIFLNVLNKLLDFLLMTSKRLLTIKVAGKPPKCVKY